MTIKFSLPGSGFPQGFDVSPYNFIWFPAPWFPLLLLSLINNSQLYNSYNNLQASCAVPRSKESPGLLKLKYLPTKKSVLGVYSLGVHSHPHPHSGDWAQGLQVLYHLRHVPVLSVFLVCFADRVLHFWTQSSCLHLLSSCDHRHAPPHWLSFEIGSLYLLDRLTSNCYNPSPPPSE
jgi:hypothetical protein